MIVFLDPGTGLFDNQGAAVRGHAQGKIHVAVTRLVAPNDVLVRRHPIAIAQERFQFLRSVQAEPGKFRVLANSVCFIDGFDYLVRRSAGRTRESAIDYLA